MAIVNGTFVGEDMFGGAVIGVRGNSGSLGLLRPDRENEFQTEAISLTRESVEELARWVLGLGADNHGPAQTGANKEG